MRSTVIVDGRRVAVYRGGNSVTLKSNEYRVLTDGTQRGLSVNTNALKYKILVVLIEFQMYLEDYKLSSKDKI